MRAFTKELLTTRTMTRGWQYKSLHLVHKINSIAYGNGIFVAVGNKGDVCISNNNGSSWTTYSIGYKNPSAPMSTKNDWKGVGYAYNSNDGLHYFYLVGQGSYYTYTTDNGATWATTTKLVEGSSTYYNAVAVVKFGSQFYQYYAGDSGYIYSSSSGESRVGTVSWDDCTTSFETGGAPYYIGSGYYTAGGSNKYFLNSTIGEHDTPHIRKVNGKYIITAKSNGLHVGNSTTLSAASLTNNTTCPVSPIDIAYLNGLYIVAGVGGIAWSPDLSNWEMMSWDLLGFDDTAPKSMAVSNNAIVITKDDYVIVKQLA